jgi:hypothetical protein
VVFQLFVLPIYQLPHCLVYHSEWGSIGAPFWCTLCLAVYLEDLAICWILPGSTCVLGRAIPFMVFVAWIRAWISALQFVHHRSWSLICTPEPPLRTALVADPSLNTPIQAFCWHLSSSIAKESALFDSLLCLSLVERYGTVVFMVMPCRLSLCGGEPLCGDVTCTTVRYRSIRRCCSCLVSRTKLLLLSLPELIYVVRECMRWFLIVWALAYWISALDSHLFFSGGTPTVASIFSIGVDLIAPVMTCIAWFKTLWRVF